MIVITALQTSDWKHIPEEARPRVCEDTTGIVAWRDGELQAACIYDTWTYNSCQIHIYIPNPMVLKHGFAEAVFEYAFSERSGRKTIIGVTPADNAPALKFIRHMGFVDIGVIPDGYKEGVDFILTQMRKENCKWINKTAPKLAAVG